MNISTRFGADGDRDFQLLWEDGDRVFCRAWRREADGRRHEVLAVLPATEHPTAATLARLAHEDGLKDALDGTWAARPLELVRDCGQTMLVLEGQGGEPLGRLLGASMEVGRFLHLAIGIAVALGKVHQAGLVHKDVKPANILVNRAGEVRLTGFGIASRLPRERQALEPPETIAGTLAYMAPEQTGRMNRSVDARSDLYALGITLYQMLTGTLPFTAADPMRLVHCHIARQPIPPEAVVANVPATVSDIVMKLLAKTAEERYQTASGLERDLRRCLADWDAHGGVDDFPLGAHDVPERLMIPETLYGREREIATLLATFDRVVATGATELVLVSGYSGIGKSSVVNELHKALVPPRGLFASGKFDQYKRDIPYATVAQAFRDLVHVILGENDAELSVWRGDLLAALGPNGQLIVNLIPELALVIGKQPPVPDVAPQDAQRHFHRVFRRFLGVFAQAVHPLVLFLDDLQWMDVAKYELLEYLLTQHETRHLLLVGAYRDNEVGPVHPLTRMLAAIRWADVRVREIVLVPLRLVDLGRLIADALHCPAARARPLARLVQEKTAGNPFFAIQFLAALAEGGLLRFDPAAPGWRWDVGRIRARNYTDNVVDLMTGKLRRLPAGTRDAVQKLACLGNEAETDMLTLALGGSEAAAHAALADAVRAGLIFRLERAYRFPHDRIHQAAYALIPEAERADIHVRIGRRLLAGLAGDDLAEHVFDLANQFNRGAARVTDPAEKEAVAALNLRAGRKAKAAAAYAAACAYLAAGMALFEEIDWERDYALMFELWFEGAECAFRSGNFAETDDLLKALLPRAASSVDQASVYHLTVQVQIIKGEYAQAIDSALSGLRLFGIDLPAHPSWDQVQTAYEATWRELGTRPIERLIDLPLMEDPQLQAAMRLLSVSLDPAYFTDFHLFCLLQCRTVHISLQHGMSGAAAQAHGLFGMILGPVFHRYRDGNRFAKLACDAVGKYGFSAYQARVSYISGMVSIWTQPIASAIDLLRTALDRAIETADLTFVCYSLFQRVTDLLVRNDPLDVVWDESQRGLAFASQTGYRDVVDMIVSQQRFIAAMQGRTSTFSSFNDSKFNESAFETQLTTGRMSTVVCSYWILKAKARFMSGDYAEALAAAGKAKATLLGLATQIQLLDYFFYTALTVAVLYDDAPADRQAEWRDLLTEHQDQLQEWADSYQPTFGDKHALVSAEIARLEGRDGDAMQLYEQAIQGAREHGFVQNEGVAHELAARFYALRGVATIAQIHSRNARFCYLRWGAAGKVRQLEQAHPWLRDDAAPLPAIGTIDASVERFELAAVVRAAQAVSGEILLDRLIQTLMTLALEHAGAERGLLILLRGDVPHVAAEARTDHRTVDVSCRQAAVNPSELPETLLRTVLRTQESVIVDDAAAPNPFSADAYFQVQRVRSVLCLPLLKQAELIGLLYLENNLTPHVFTPARIAVLGLLASQAAISLENARLYSDLLQENRERQMAEAALRRSEAYLAEAQRLSRTGSFGWHVASGDVFWSEESFAIFGYDKAPSATLEMALRRVHPDDFALAEQIIDRASRIGEDFDVELRLLLPDGAVRYVHAVGRAARDQTGELEFIGSVMDVTAAKRAAESLQKAQADLAHAARVTTLGELAASIAHEINQPLAAVATSGNACLHWLNRDTPDLDAVRQAVTRIVQNAHRAGDVIRSLRALTVKSGPQLMPLDLKGAIQEVLALTRSELHRRGVTLHMELDAPLPQVLGEKVQLQQVMLNLITNAMDAMAEVADCSKVLVISANPIQPNGVLVSVEDTGTGFDPAKVEQIFAPFYTTKSSGMGMGLSICKTIIEAHGGKLSAQPNLPQGAIFRFRLPAAGCEVS